MLVDLVAVGLQPDVLAATGDSIATELKDFIAPIAAALVGAVGVKYLFGEERSLAGFIGFVFLGVFVYTLIKWGNTLLSSLGEIVNNILT